MKGSGQGAAAKAAPDLGPSQYEEDAARTTLAFNPMFGLQTNDLAGAAATVMKAMVTQPTVAAKAWMGFMTSLAGIVTGNADAKPDPRDKRFADPTWQKSKLHTGLWQTYMAWSKALNEFVSTADFSAADRQRAQLVSSILIDAMAPSNIMLANPAAVRKIADTGGASLLDSAKNFVNDMIENGGMPSTVDKSKFKLGENIAISPGAVVFRNEIIELIQYAPNTPEVYKRPMLMVPPQINKFYSVDLAPDKSMVAYLVRNGIQTFVVSWRNPTPAQRNWGLTDYVLALDEAVDAIRDITGSETINLLGPCSGGITASTYAGYLAARGETKIESLVLAVCVLDTSSAQSSQFAAMVTPETVRAAREISRVKGVLEGAELARVFAWMRPNDLIWNYWVNNYLLGNPPPAFDVLYWNADTTRLPMQLHHDYLDLIAKNPFVEAGAMTIGGEVIDMKKVKLDTYVVGGTTDHITPWKACYATARLFGKRATFVLSNSGHLQSLLNPPGAPKATFVAGPANERDAEDWALKHPRTNGSWWIHWLGWVQKHSGDKAPAPAALGSTRHPQLMASPGSYVLEP